MYIVKIRTEDMEVVESVKKAYKGDVNNKFVDVNVPKFMDQDPKDDSQLMIIG